MNETSSNQLNFSIWALFRTIKKKKCEKENERERENFIMNKRKTVRTQECVVLPLMAISRSKWTKTLRTTSKTNYLNLKEKSLSIAISGIIVSKKINRKLLRNRLFQYSYIT